MNSTANKIIMLSSMNFQAGVQPGDSIPDNVEIEVTKLVIRASHPPMPSFFKEKNNNLVHGFPDIGQLPHQLRNCHSPIDEVWLENVKMIPLLAKQLTGVDKRCWKSGVMHLMGVHFAEMTDRVMKQVFDGDCFAPRQLTILGTPGLTASRLAELTQTACLRGAEVLAITRFDHLAEAVPAIPPDAIVEWLYSGSDSTTPDRRRARKFYLSKEYLGQSTGVVLELYKAIEEVGREFLGIFI